MKRIKVPNERGAKQEISEWLKEHISAENVRWWFDRRERGEIQPDGHIPSWDTVMVDLTEEEEPMLTLFLLRWS